VDKAEIQPAPKREEVFMSLNRTNLHKEFSWQRKMMNAYPYFTEEDDFMESVWIPAVDIFEREEKITVRAELPGIKKTDLDVSIEDDILTIAGERNQDPLESEDAFLRRGRFYGAFCRSFSLPAPVDTQKIKAVFKDGVLELDLPKKGEDDINKTGEQYSIIRIL
jgi:HSP20 family protein